MIHSLYMNKDNNRSCQGGGGGGELSLTGTADGLGCVYCQKA